MTISLTAVVIRHERRIRLAFSEQLAAGAFTSTSYYAVTSLDGAGVTPVVDAALVVPNSNNVVELALGADLAAGGLYSISAVAVPAQAGSFTPNPTGDTVRFAAQINEADSERDTVDIDGLIYGRDIIFSGVDFVESPDGDLDDIEGPANARAALSRRLLGSPLLWSPGYSPNVRSFVDAPGGLPQLRGAMIRQAQLDDRVAAVSVVLTQDAQNPKDPGNAYFAVNARLVGDGDAARVVVAAPR